MRLKVPDVSNCISILETSIKGRDVNAQVHVDLHAKTVEVLSALSQHDVQGIMTGAGYPAEVIE